MRTRHHFVRLNCFVFNPAIRTGRLILANFSIERRNGSYFLEKLGGVPMSSLSPEHPTNLSVDKPVVMHDDSKQHMSLSALSLHGDLSSSCSHPLTGDIEHWTVAIDAADSMPQNLSTMVHGTWHVSKGESLEHAQIEDLSIAEKPVDATLPRSHLGAIRCTANVNPPQSRDSEDSILMGQFGTLFPVPFDTFMPYIILLDASLQMMIHEIFQFS